MRSLSCTLLTLTILLSFSQVFSQNLCSTGEYYLPTSSSCVLACPTYTYIGSYKSQAACLAQTGISAVVHPTVYHKFFMLSFSDAPVPFTTIAELEQGVTIVMSSPYTNTTTVNFVAAFQAQDRSVVQVYLDVQVIPLQATFMMYFPNFQINNNSQNIHNWPSFLCLPTIR